MARNVWPKNIWRETKYIKLHVYFLSWKSDFSMKSIVSFDCLEYALVWSQIFFLLNKQYFFLMDAQCLVKSTKWNFAVQKFIDPKWTLLECKISFQLYQLYQFKGKHSVVVVQLYFQVIALLDQSGCCNTSIFPQR